jgi:predicted ArsR family transcriptional regulator
MTPLPDRILGALSLQPMTIADLACSLWLSTSAVRHSLAALRESGDVKCVGTAHRKSGAPRKLWRIA